MGKMEKIMQSALTGSKGSVQGKTAVGLSLDVRQRSGGKRLGIRKAGRKRYLWGTRWQITSTQGGEG